MIAVYALAVGLLAGPPAAVWEIPYCAADRRQRLVGEGLAVPVSKDAKLKTGGDVDFTCTAVRLRASRLSFVACGGPNFTHGHPRSDLLSDSREVEERRIRFPGIPADWSWEYGPLDVRGTTSGGKRWRYIGMLGGSIVYEGVDKGAEAALDAALDRLCWRYRDSDESAQPSAASEARPSPDGPVRK